MFFREDDSSRQRIDYHAAVSGNLRLVPSGAAQGALAEGYATMLPIRDVADDEPFDTLMQRCALIEERANAHAHRTGPSGGETHASIEHQ